MLVLDTDVLAEAVRPEPAPAVAHWLSTHPAQDLYTTTVSLAEMLFSIALMPEGRRRARLEHAVGEVFSVLFGDRLLAFDDAAARSYAAFAAARQRMGLRVSVPDGQIVAIARSHGAEGIVTRNLRDFAHCGLKLIDPWTAARR
jgi:predicted nucleic acid-binding protein